jgi:RimJ/RimL family protein N-acetyltransferase
MNMKIVEADDFVTTIKPLAEKLLPEANAFAQKMLFDKYFTHFKHTMPEEMLSDEWEVWLVEYGNVVIGWGQIQKFPRNKQKQHVVRLGFAVLPEFRGRGIGSEIVDFTLERCKNYSKVTATTFTDNITMLGMFLKRGFVIEGCFRNEERQDELYRHVVSLARYQ